MRRKWFCVPMISLLLLTGCAGGEVSEAEREALLIRSQYLEAEEYSGRAALTADYGRRVYEFQMDFRAAGEETELTVTAPETVAGIAARTEKGKGFLICDDLVLETGALDEEGLTPMTAVPAVLEETRSGFISACSYTEEGLLRVDCRDPEEEPGQGREISLWFDGEHRLSRGEICRDGLLQISCQFSDFTMK